MSVMVSPGSHQVRATCRGAYVPKAFPTIVRELGGTSLTNDVGTQKKSTSPRIVVEGTKWSLAHPYTRAGIKITNLNGRIDRGYYNGAGKNIYAFMEGGLPAIGGISVPKRYYQSPFADSVGVPGPMPGNLRARLNTELLAKVGHRQWSMGESLAESRKTIIQMSKLTSDVVRALLYFRKGNWRYAARILNLRGKGQIKSGVAPSQRWLEFQYGILPLLSDIYDAHKVITGGLNRPHLIRATRRISPYDTYDMSGLSATDNPVTGKSVSSAQGRVYYRLNNKYLSYLSQLGLINPLEVAWALVPFSFVTDWFLPVQTFLEATTASVGLTFVDGSFTYRVETTSIYGPTNHSSLNAGAGYPLRSSSPFYKVDQFGITREPVTGLAALPYVKNPFSSNHVISALALLRQLRKAA